VLKYEILIEQAAGVKQKLELEKARKIFSKTDSIATEHQFAEYKR
jgi:hypothetical protein